ncbi:MAG: DinB family protein [Planctomycetota bacterium]|nr:DinB family protein [Planctomycetota bacterium]
MSERVAWTERTFDFDFPDGLYREFMERLRGTPVRVEELIRSVPADRLTACPDQGWSIQQNVGHLLDLEPLVMTRLDEYDAGAAVLHAADMSNRKTNQAGHNDKSIESILSAFAEARAELVRRLESLAPARFGQTALHPRLNQPMRIVDMMYFQAEHDDYHLARITELNQ